MEYKLQEVRPRIFLLTFDNAFDLGMTFLRSQEYYENPVFRRKIFEIIDFIEWYSKSFNKENVFSYCDDWSGFNVPSWVLSDIYGSSPKERIDDWNKYDAIMHGIREHISFKVYKDDNFYLIGAKEGAEDTIKHEIAHGFWATNKEYNKEMQELVNKIPPEIKNVLTTWMSETMYSEDVHDDECNAYLSTGLAQTLRKAVNKHKIKIKPLRKPFIEVFNRYYEKPI